MPLRNLLRRNETNIEVDRVTHRSIKVVLLGESGVGKSSLFCRYVYNSFHPFVEPTIGAAFCTRTVVIHDEDEECNNDNDKTKKTHNVHLNIWDTAGQERYEALSSMYFRNAGAAILVYDITRIHSFQAMQRWMRQVKEHTPSTTSMTSNIHNNELILVIVGNKSDLADHRSVTHADAQDYADSQNAIYTETSAKDNDCVVELFEEILARRAMKIIEPEVSAPHETGTPVALGRADDTWSRSCC
jgi:Ras-related protein Rab-22